MENIATIDIAKSILFKSKYFLPVITLMKGFLCSRVTKINKATKANINGMNASIKLGM